MSYAKHFSTRQTPQSEPIPGTDQIKNAAGGYTFSVDDWQRLDRFLILGNEGGTYYTSEQKLTVENAKCLIRCLNEDPIRTVNRIIGISESGRAPKNDAAIFALACACGYKGPDIVRELALNGIAKVCRIGTHLFQFMEAIEKFRGYGRSMTRALANWYTKKDANALAYQVSKYQQRNGWSHRDVLRLCHAKATTDDQQMVFKWVVNGAGEDWTSLPSDKLVPIWAFEQAKAASTKAEIVRLIDKFGLVREHIPTKWLVEPLVWEALLEKMPMTALIRNLATMTKIGLIAPLSAAAGKAIAKIADTTAIKKSRLHPFAILVALKTYASGRGFRGGSTWTPVQQVVDALDGAFYKSFVNVEKTGKNFLLGLDVSGSMDSSIIHNTNVTAREAAAAMAMVTAAVEPHHMFLAFTSGTGSTCYNRCGVEEVSISPRQRLDDVVNVLRNIPFGGTDCSLPMLYAFEKMMPIDVFAIYTDSETWAGKIHASQALTQYRERMGRQSKAVCVGMTATQNTVFDPNDFGSMNVVGFDTAAPQLISRFVADTDEAVAITPEDDSED